MMKQSHGQGIKKKTRITFCIKKNTINEISDYFVSSRNPVDLKRFLPPPPKKKKNATGTSIV